MVAPLIKNSGEFIAKHIEYEKSQSLIAEADRALELIGRSIRMAGYQNPKLSSSSRGKNVPSREFIHIQKDSGYRGSDTLIVKHEISSGLDFDCIGNVLSKERTKQGLAQQGFLVDRQASAPKGVRVNGGSLICQSLDKHGRLQNTTLMNGVDLLAIEGLVGNASRVFRVRLRMTDGGSINKEFERTFATRNLL